MEKVDTTPNGFSVHTREGRGYESTVLIIATGASAQPLNIPGEREFMGRGLGCSAVSYAPLFIDREAVVIGDGDLAMRSAAELATHAQRVFLVAPTHGKLDSPLGQRLERAENVTILEGYEAQAVKGDIYARSLVIAKERTQEELVVDGIFIEMDLIPHSELVAHLVDLDEKGRIKIDFQNRTSRPGIFAASDVTNAYREQVLIAVGEGAKAALSAYEYLLEVGLVADKPMTFSPEGET